MRILASTIGLLALMNFFQVANAIAPKDFAPGSSETKKKIDRAHKYKKKKNRKIKNTGQLSKIQKKINKIISRYKIRHIKTAENESNWFQKKALPGHFMQLLPEGKELLNVRLQSILESLLWLF